MADDKQSGPGLGGNSVVLLLAAAASAVYMGWRSPPLFSTRPTEPDYEISQTESEQDVDARLWQDPFAAVQRALEDKRNGNLDPREGHCLANFQEVVKKRDLSEQVLLVGVDLPGDPYPEAVETRRRLRYAVLSSLHVEKYVPVDERHIGYFWTGEKPTLRPTSKPETVVSGLFRIAKAAGGDPPVQGAFDLTANGAAKCREMVGDDKLSVPAIVPFEQYQAIDEKKRVIVLWLDEEALAHRQHPIASLAGLLCKLDLNDENNESFVFLGPQDSDVLQRMVQEIKEDKDHQLLDCEVPKGTPSAAVPTSTKADADETVKAPPRKPIPRLAIYNYGATAEGRIVLQRAGYPEAADIKRLFRGSRVDYYRTISSDEELAEVLAQELSRRGIDLCPKQISRDVVPPAGSRCPRPHHDRVFLLSEWDTAYGRYLPQSVSDTFGADDSSFGGCRLKTSRGIMHASYLRGLDGRLPGRRPSKGALSSGGQNGGQASAERGEQADGGGPSVTPETASRFESAEGQSQFDYLRRLTEALKECDKKLRFEGAGKIAAIGVLGSDVYDKLLLLQALRPEFPEATFFTTDLDELLLPQEKLRYTRNLLVASGHGLTVIPELQKDVLPFRSSYQTSLFLATTLAIRNSNSSTPKTDAKRDPWPDTTAALGCWSKHPLLFQIGRTTARGLPTKPLDGEEKACQNQTEDPHAGFIKSKSIEPAVAALYPDFTGQARFGIFVTPFVLLGIIFSSPTIRRVCFGKLARPRPELYRLWARRVGVAFILLSTLAVWALVVLDWPHAAPWLTEYGNGEPMSVFEGVSVWPTIALRGFGALLALFFIWYTLRNLEDNLQNTERRFRLDDPPRTLSQSWRRLRRNKIGVLEAIRSLLWFPSGIRSSMVGGDDEERRNKWFTKIAVRYSGSWQVRCLRAAIGVALMGFLWSIILTPIFGDLNDPARGNRAQHLYDVVTLCEVLSTLFLTFLVADATLYSREFIRRLTAVSTVWPQKTVAEFMQKYWLENPDDLSDWMDIQFLAKRTASITQLIYFPFLALTVLILSRSPLLDNFSMPWTVVIAQAISVSVVIGAAFAYRSSAERARRVACEHLTRRIIATKAADGVWTSGQLEKLLMQMQDLREGAFAPLTSQPIVKAVLFPLVTYGGTWLAHLYGMPGT
jgi:hypothetical protein